MKKFTALAVVMALSLFVFCALAFVAAPAPAYDATVQAAIIGTCQSAGSSAASEATYKVDTKTIGFSSSVFALAKTNLAIAKVTMNEAITSGPGYTADASVAIDTRTYITKASRLDSTVLLGSTIAMEPCVAYSLTRSAIGASYSG